MTKPFCWREPERPFAAHADLVAYQPWLVRKPWWKRLREVFR